MSEYQYQLISAADRQRAIVRLSAMLAALEADLGLDVTPQPVDACPFDPTGKVSHLHIRTSQPPVDDSAFGYTPGSDSPLSGEHKAWSRY